MFLQITAVQKLKERRRPNVYESVCEVIAIVDAEGQRLISFYEPQSAQTYRGVYCKDAMVDAELSIGDRVYVWFLVAGRVIVSLQ
jgi:hypothetical protein